MERQLRPLAVLGGLLDLALPKRCVRCGVAGEWLCADCVAGLRPLPAEACPHCGAPGGRAVGCCRECRERELWFVSATAAFTYEDAARALVTACKFRAYRSLAADMGRRAAPSFVAACRRLGAEGAADGGPLVTWVPGHRDHVLERGFNQAELLARELARHAGLPSAPLLRRVRHGARQSGLGRVARAANAQNTFALREDADRVRKRLQRVMIVDDVYTTGETLSHCAEVLIYADLEPHAFTFARTVRAVPTQTTLDDAVRKERCR
jgi:ComF family protein